MHAKQRNGRFQLYRSTYVRKGKNGNSHGYGLQKFVGSLAADSLEIPPELAGKLTDEECGYVERKVLGPARQAAEAKRVAEAMRERDPNWRVKEAVRLLREADKLAKGDEGILEAQQVKDLLDVARALSMAGGAPEAEKPLEDPLGDVLVSIQRAAQAVGDGCYGRAPAKNFNATQPAQLWKAITQAINGDVAGSLLRRMQDAGFVKAKGR